MSLIPPYLRMIPGGAADNISNRSSARQVSGVVKGKAEPCPVSVELSCKASKFTSFACAREADRALENVIQGLEQNSGQTTPGEIHSFLNHQNALSLLTSWRL